MGEGQLLTTPKALTGALLAWLGTAATASAQGLVYRERWGYLHLEERRAEVRHELAGRDAATVARVRELLGEPDKGMAFGPLARALAHLRGVPCDDAFVLRTLAGMFVLPEVCDPEAANEVCRSTHVSMFLPFTVPVPGAMSFEVVVTDAAGEVVHRQLVTRDTEMADVRMGRPTAEIPGKDLPDGTYTVALTTRLEGVPTAATDPTRTWTCHVLRGYQARAEKAIGAAKQLEGPQVEGVGAIAAMHVQGALAAVLRAYHGETFAGRSDAVHDLLRLETVLANVAAKRDFAEGLDRDRVLALPLPDAPALGCVLRLHEKPSRPLVVWIAGLPTYDGEMMRPAAPATRDPAWLARELADFATTHEVHVACLESPGGGRDYGRALRHALAQLGELVPAAGKPLLVCEREAAAAVALYLPDLQPLVRGLVFVGSGAMGTRALQALGDVPVRIAATRGPNETGLANFVTHVVAQRQQGKLAVDIDWLTADRPPWQFGLAPFTSDVASLLRKLTAK